MLDYRRPIESFGEAGIPPHFKRTEEVDYEKNGLIAITAVLILAFAAFKVTIAAEAVAGGQAKSLAWYVANIQEARKQNQACHDNPGLQASNDCVNALHALEISFKGGN